MENLTLNDSASASPRPQSTQAAPPVPQLPPQMFTTAASLLGLTDKKLMVALRDGRKLLGVLRSWDQFGNLLLQDTTERIFVQDVYADIAKGVMLVRGENILIMGEIDLDKDDDIPPNFRPAPAPEVHALQKAEEERRRRVEKVRRRKLHALGFEGEGVGEAVL